jgi:hypothetical protein
MILPTSYYFLKAHDCYYRLYISVPFLFMAVFRDVAPCSLAEVNRRYQNTVIFVLGAVRVWNLNRSFFTQKLGYTYRAIYRCNTVRSLIKLNAIVTSRLPAGSAIGEFILFYWSILNSYWENVEALGCESCSSSQEPGSDSTDEVCGCAWQCNLIIWTNFSRSLGSKCKMLSQCTACGK